MWTLTHWVLLVTCTAVVALYAYRRWRTPPVDRFVRNVVYNRSPKPDFPRLNTVRPPLGGTSDWTRRPGAIAIGGVVYNCAPYLDAVFENIVQILGMYRDYDIVIGIDEGTDNSLEILRKWQQRLPRLHILEGKKTSTLRTENLAIARNRVLDKLRELYPRTFFSHFIIMDCDDVCATPIRLDILQDVLRAERQWDAVSFPCKNSYYDIWALSVKPFMISFLHFPDEHRANSTMRVDIHQRLQKGDWIPCHSAFGGFAIYRVDFLNYHYDWQLHKNLAFLTLDEIAANEQAMDQEIAMKNNMDCEHRYFHFQAVFEGKARMYIYPYNLFDFEDVV